MTSSVAVIMRTRDRAVLLERALRSVAGQTRRDYQLVIVNDGGELRTVEDAVARHPDLADVVIVHNPVSVGREEATNVGVHASTAPYVAFHDDDDSWAPTYLETALPVLEHGDDGGVAVRTEVVYEEIVGDEVVELGREILKSDSSRVTLFETALSGYVPPSSLIVRRERFDEVGGWDGSLPVLADWDFTLKLLAVTTIAFIDGAPLAFWHRREQQTGVLGNSVHADADLHLAHDLTVRDGFLRRDVQSGHGLGDVLFTAELFRRDAERQRWGREEIMHRSDLRFDQVAERLETISNHLGWIARSLDGLEHRLDELESRTFRARYDRAVARVRGRGRGNGTQADATESN
ncbi:glycosyltransferase family A protein [Agromyces sp. PvR057]|uniref:glycosyltransferase family 2 protein n=1 Tax=Agromyces sp. PvR057 TaxID=3156403 RepID=UPI000E37E837